MQGAKSNSACFFPMGFSIGLPTALAASVDLPCCGIASYGSSPTMLGVPKRPSM